MQVKVTKIGGSKVIKVSKNFPDVKVGDTLWIYREEQMTLEERIKRLEKR